METTEIKSANMTENNQNDGQNAKYDEIETSFNTYTFPTNLADEQHASSRVVDEHQGQILGNTMDIHPGQMIKLNTQVAQDFNNITDNQADQVHNAEAINTEAYQTPASHENKTGFLRELLFFDNDVPYIETVFHLHVPATHFPPNSANKMKIVVLGNVRELGNWHSRNQKVQLFPINLESGHWASPSVRIKLTECRKRGYAPIEYKYSIRVGKRSELEGHGVNDNRTLNLSKYQFDIWNSKSRDLSYEEISSCSFVLDVIMDHYSSFDSKLIALEVLHTTLPKLVQQTISKVDFILQVALDVCDLTPKRILHNAGDGSTVLGMSHKVFSTERPDLIGQFIFLCLYLGQYLKAVQSEPLKNMHANAGRVNIGANVGFDFGFSLCRKSLISRLSLNLLPIEFPSSLLLSLLGHKTKEADEILRYAALQAKFSKDQWEFFIIGITMLVHHSIENGTRPGGHVFGVEPSQLEWMFAFRLTTVLSDRQLVGESFVGNYIIEKELLQQLLNTVEACEHNRCSHSVFMDRLNACIMPTLECLAAMQTELLYEYERLVKILISCAPTVESLLYLYKLCPIIFATFDANHKNQETLYGWFIQNLQADIDFQDALSLQALPDELRVSLGFSVIRDQTLKLLQNRNMKWSAPLVEAIIQLVTDEQIFPTSFPIDIDKDVTPSPNHWDYINRAMERIHAADDFFLITAFPILLHHFLQVQHYANGCFEYIVGLCGPWFQNLLRQNLLQKALTSKSASVSTTCKPNKAVADSTHRDYEPATDNQNLSSNQVYVTFLWLSRLLIILQPLVDSHHSLANQVQIQVIYLAQKHVMDMPEKLLYSATTEIGYLQPECIPKMYQIVMSEISGTNRNLDFETLSPSANNSQVSCHEWNDQLLARILQVCSSNLQNLKVQHWLAEQVVCYILDQIAPIYSKNIEPSKLASSGECTRTFELLLRNARYWLSLLMATGFVARILDHPRIRQIRDCIVALRDMIFDGSITMKLLRGTVQKTPDNILLQLFECVTLLNPTDNHEEEFRVMATQRLKKARVEPDQYLLTLQLLDQVISLFCIKAPLIQQQSKRRNPLANKPGSIMAFLTKATDDSSVAEAEYWTVTDAEEQLAYLKGMREEFLSQTLASLPSQTRWGSLQYFVQIAQNIKVFMESVTFMNVFLKTVMQFLADNSIQPLDVNDINYNKSQAPQQDNKTNDREDDTHDTYIQTNAPHVLTVANIAKLILTALDNYCILARLYVAPTPTEVKELTIADVLSVWHDISDDLVERELEMLRLALNLFNPSFKTDLQTDTSMIRRVISIEDRARKLSEILAALAMLESVFSHSKNELSHSENILHRPSWVNTTIKLLFDTRKVEHLESVFNSLEHHHFIKLSDTDWRLISELTVSGELFRFLKTILDMDFRSLINAVEDHSDQQLLREDTVSSLIEVRRLLSPFMGYFTKRNGNMGNPQKYGAVIDEFLDDIHQATEKSPQLPTRLSNCNANRIALQNLYANITNRGEVTKERIINAVTIGSFTFKRTENGSACDTSMCYKNKQGDILVYNLNDLYDLRGRAFMIAGSVDKTVMISNMDRDSNTFRNSSSNLREMMMAFVQKVDVANEINITASKLIDLGHFTYAKNLNHSVISIKDMTSFLKKLAKELHAWQETVAIAHARSFYLTFFRGRQILRLYDLFIGTQKVSEENLQEGAALLKFVSSRAEYISIISTLIDGRREKRDSSAVQNGKNKKRMPLETLETLLAVGHHLDKIFADMPQHNVSKDLAGVLDQKDINSSPFPCLGQLVVAACNDKTRIPNIVMELYVTTVSQRPEPWQLYVCHLATTWEEIDLFLLRCFHAHAHGYENSLFCMTNLEELDFDLQNKLVKRVRALISTFTNCQHFLALICYREHGGIHILDQFAEYVRNISGLSEKSMKQVMTKICPTIVRVTSNITGEGKTEWIKDYSHSQWMIPRNLHLSGTIQRASLVRRLQTCQLLKSHECLHLDIGHVQNPSELNILLFEFLTLGMLTSEASIAILPTKHIFIEIASTPDHELARSIPICDSLTTIHLYWDIDRLLVSREPCSPIQITCRFLDLLDREILDNTDVDFASSKAIQVVQESDRCRALLDKYFFQGRAEISSFRFLDIFLRVLAEQLMRLSKSTFFSVLNLKLMSGENNHIRSTLVDALINVSKDFATRSVASSTLQKSQLSQIASATSNVESSVSLPNDPERISSDIGHDFCLTRWTDSNHLLVFFQSQNPEAISALYRDRALVPKNIEKLLQSQLDRGQTGASDFALEDFDKLQPEQLLAKLEALARSSLHPKRYPEYALSPDNLLKMAIMLLRLRADLPVVLCGEAGCGKTSLIRFLSLVVEVPHFMVLNMHAGITEEQIIDFMNEAQEKADSSEVVWVFFDEINTCNHLPLVADIICHKVFLGRPVNKKLQFFAACNPYRLRDQTKTGVAGLSLQDKRYEERSPLVYQVLPLPQTLIDYVWSFGALQPKDEEACINVMVKSQDLPLFFAELIFQSQQFMREMDGPFSVSLRDVKRTLQLFTFFLNSLQERYKLSASNYPPSNEAFSWPLRAVVLALALSYQARMFDQSQRLKYRQLMCSILQSHQHYVTDKIFQQILREEEEDYLKRMTIPPSIAWNEALLENTLAMIVCILTQIPLFLVGAPGSSKSLAVRLIHQNLKGSDSIDAYFRTLPQIYIIPHQGSSSSTSEGITKVFETANKYQEMTLKAFPVRTVVLLDEIGLAEGSPFNPLKVLHYLLEPSYPSKGPTVSVIGISNWRLDLSKTSRALLVQRPQLSLEDLVDTAMRVAWNDQIVSGPQKLRLQRIAQVYTEYEKAQKHTNFHGLRDYYAFVKTLGKCGGSLSPSALHFALARNFGGLDDKEPLWCRFSPIIYDIPGDQMGYQDIPVLDVIISNLKDTIEGRHLMVIGNTGAVVGILQHVMKSQGLDPVVIYGSQLPDDQMTSDYSYGILNKILMCVESGRPLILSNLNILYGSLYDLWNQNYMAVGSKDDPKYYCRVALGEYANPMCYVHPRFRSILVMDENEVQFADPPLLNRFEKQRLSLNDTLEQSLTSVVEELTLWTQRISIPVADSSSSSYALEDNERTLEIAAWSFTVEDMFVGFDKQVTLESLVIYNSTKHDLSILLDACKTDLINMACSDAIIRSGDSILATIDSQEVAHWKDVYFNQQQHDNLRSCITALLMKNFLSTSQLIMITTLSNISFDINTCLEGLLQCQVDKLSTFKSEAQLTKRLKNYWNEPSNELLILQCDGQNTSEGVLKLAKYIIELQRREYLAGFSHATSYSAIENCPDSKIRVPTKHVIIMLHVHRGIKGTGSRSTHFDFLSGWSQVVIETLEQQPRPLSHLLEGNIGELAQTLYPFEDIFRRELSWCLVSMKYPASIKGLEHLKTLIQRISSCDRLIRIIHRRVNEWLNENEQPNWQLMIARSKQMLLLSSSFYVALDRHIRNTIRIPIAKIICSLEQLSALTTYLDLNEQCPFDNDSIVATTSNPELLEFWEKIFEDKTVVSIDHLANPGPDAYSISSANLVQLRFPFSKYFADQIDRFRQIFQEVSDTWKLDDANLDPKTGDIYPQVLESHFLLFSNSVETKIGYIHSIVFRKYAELYFEDYMRLILLSLGYVNVQHERILKNIFERRIHQQVSDPIRLHIEWWRNNAVILAELELVLSCAADILQSKDSMESAEFNDFEEWLMNACLDRLLRALLTEERKDFDGSRWCQNATMLLSFCLTTNSSRLSPGLQFLRILNDFVSALVVSLGFPLSKLRNAIIDALNVDKADFSATQNVFTDTFVSRMLAFVLSLAGKNYNECKHMLWRTFLSHSLNALLPNSESYVTLCQLIFSEVNTNIPFLGPILLRILREEEQLHPDFVRDLILLQKPSMTHENVESVVAKPTPNEIIELNPRLYAINKSLTVAGLNSRLAALTCDVIQMGFFAPLDFDQLCVMFCNIKEVILTVGQLEVLQSIIVIAYLKELISGFQKRYVKEFGSLESTMELERATEFQKIILDVNNMFELNLQLPIVNSARIYFLKDLRITMSMNDLRQFCSFHHHQLPWLDNLEWDFTVGEERLPFNPFHYMLSYGDANVALANLANKDNDESLTHLLTKAVNNVDERATLLGSLAMGFQFKHATRKLNDVETRAANWIRDRLQDDQFDFSDKYRHLGASLLTNSHPLIQVSQNDSVPTLLMKSVAIHVIILHVSMSADASPLAAYAHDVPNISQTYLLTFPSDTESVVLNALIKSEYTLSRWSCQCGFHYVVGECGLTMQVGICPQCKNKIGGQNHQPMEGNIKLDVSPVNDFTRDQVGYIFEEVTNISSCGHAGHSVRSLHQTAYRILHLFVHALLPPSVVTGTEWKQYCMNHIENDWIQLKIILNCNDETLALILHAVVVKLRSFQSLPIASSSRASPNPKAALQTVELRDQWEKTFSEYCVFPVICNVHQKSVEFAQWIRSEMDPSLLNIEMNELETFMTQEYIESHHPRLWRLVDRTSYDNLLAYYWSDPIHQRKHRFLSIFFQHQERLDRIQHLIPIIKFVGIVSTRLAHRLKRQEARSLTFRLFLEQQHDSQALEASFDQFAHAWNSIRSHITRYQCHEFESIPMIDREMPITFAILREEDESIYILAVLDYLVNIQNGFLNETNNAIDDLHVAAGERPTYEAPKTSLGQPRYLRSVRLTDAHRAQVIVYEWDPAILQYSQRSTDLGMGSSLAYDLAKIEGELVHQLVFGKTHLAFEWEPFVFHLELFHGGADVLADVAAIVEQEPISADTAAAISTDGLVIERASEILSDLELLISFIKRTGIAAVGHSNWSSSSDMLIVDFCKQWVKLSVLLSKFFQQTMLATMQLKHVVSLYEIVEEMVSDILLQFLASKYKQSLSPSVEKELTDALDWHNVELALRPDSSVVGGQRSSGGRIPASTFATALKRFMTRYLSVGHGDVRADTQLIYYLGDPVRFWPLSGISGELKKDLTRVLEESFPESLMVSHTHAAYGLITTQLELQRLADSHSTRSFTTTASPSLFGKPAMPEASSRSLHKD